MLFHGAELRKVLETTSNDIELRNEYGGCHRKLSKEEALALDPDLFIGIGNRRRIRFLRLRTQKYTLNAGSHTTQRPKNAGGRYIAHPIIREHRMNQRRPEPPKAEFQKRRASRRTWATDQLFLLSRGGGRFQNGTSRPFANRNGSAQKWRRLAASPLNACR
jgi:hypothetical protein